MSDRIKDINFSLVLGSVTLALVIFALDLTFPRGIAGGVPYMAVILLGLWSPRKRFIILSAIVCSVLTALGFYFSSPEGEFWQVVVNRIFALFAIWVTALLCILEKKQHAELIETNKKLATQEIAVLDHVPDGIIIIDEHGTIASFYPAAERLFGYKASEVLGQNVKILMPEPHRSEHDRFLKKYLESGISKIIGIGREVVGLQKDGTLFNMDLRVSEMYLGEKRMFAGFVRDISERKRNEKIIEAHTRDLKKANDRLYCSNKELDDFAYIVSHDLKEPLRGIYNFATFVKEDYLDKLDEDGKAKLDTLVRLSQRMEALINSILQYARLGRTDLNMKPVDLNTILDDVLDNLQSIIEEFRVEVRIPEPLPVINCDELWVREALQNLISNAMKYNDKMEKWVEVGCSFKEADEPAGKGTSPVPVFYVKDNGIGISEKYFDSLFRIFKRLNGRKSFGDGTGAGTTIAKKVIERHNGKIWLESKEGEGTTFYFTLGGENENAQYQIPSLDSVG